LSFVVCYFFFELCEQKTDTLSSQLSTRLTCSVQRVVWRAVASERGLGLSQNQCLPVFSETPREGYFTVGGEEGYNVLIRLYSGAGSAC
jgi:hypothetical protein